MPYAQTDVVPSFGNMSFDSNQRLQRQSNSQMISDCYIHVRENLLSFIEQWQIVYCVWESVADGGYDRAKLLVCVAEAKNLLSTMGAEIPPMSEVKILFAELDASCNLLYTHYVQMVDDLMEEIEGLNTDLAVDFHHFELYLILKADQKQSRWMQYAIATSIHQGYGLTLLEIHSVVT